MTSGGAMGGHTPGTIHPMGQQAQPSINTPPSVPNVEFMVSVNGQQMGPFNMSQLQQMTQTGQFNSNTYVWRQGMAQWELAANVQELSSLFAPSCPPPPPPPAP